MLRTAQLPAGAFRRGVAYRWRGWRESFGGVGRRLFEGLGAALVLASLLLLLALLTYSPGDASLDTAADSPIRNYLGHDGALIADALVQSVGLAAYLVPAVLLGWAFRLMLQQPIRRPLRALALLLLALGRGAGRGASRVALASGHGTAAAASFGRRLFRRWRQARQEARQAAGADRVARLVANRDPRGNPFPGRSVVTPLSGAFDQDRREPQLGRGAVPSWGGPPAGEIAPTGAAPGRLVRLVMPRLKPSAPGRRAEQELQPALDLLDEEPLLPPLGLLSKPPAIKTASVDEEALAKNARMLEAVLEDFGVKGQIVQ